MEIKREFLEKFQKGLFLAYPAILMLDSKLANNFMVFLLLVLALGNVFVNKKIVFTFYEKFMLLFVAALLISVVFKDISAGSGLVMIKRHFRWLILPTLLGQLTIKKEDIKITLTSIAIGVLGYLYRFINEVMEIKNSNLSLVQFFSSLNFWNYRFMLKSNLPQVALILGVTAIILFYIYSVSQEKNKIYMLVFSILSLLLMSSTQSRGMLLTVFIMIFLLAILRREKTIRVTAVLLVLSAVTVGIVFSNSNYVNRYENLGKDSSSLARVEVYKETFEIFKDNKINGIGLEGFVKAQDMESHKYHKKYYHPHNMALKLLAETGILGFTSYYLFMGSILLALWKKYRENKYYLTGILATLTLLLYENIETMFITVVALPYVFFIIGLNLNSVYKDKLNKK